MGYSPFAFLPVFSRTTIPLEVNALMSVRPRAIIAFFTLTTAVGFTSVSCAYIIFGSLANSVTKSL